MMNMQITVCESGLPDSKPAEHLEGILMLKEGGLNSEFGWFVTFMFFFCNTHGSVSASFVFNLKNMAHRAAQG